MNSAHNVSSRASTLSTLRSNRQKPATASVGAVQAHSPKKYHEPCRSARSTTASAPRTDRLAVVAQRTRERAAVNERNVDESRRASRFAPLFLRWTAL